MSAEALENFREIVFNDPDLQAELSDVLNVHLFTVRVVELAAQHELNVEPSDIAAAMNAGRRALIEQWI